MRRWLEAGDLAWGMVLELATMAISIAIIVGSLGSITTFWQQQHFALAQGAQLGRFLDVTQAESNGAGALFIPSHDVFGASQNVVTMPWAPDTQGRPGYGTPVVPANGAREVDYYAKDAKNVGHFWAYYFDTSKHVIEKFSYTRRGPTGLAEGLNTTPQATWNNVAGFEGSYLPSTEVPNINPVVYYATQHGYVPKDVLVHMAFPEVYGGNRAVAMDIWSTAPDAKVRTWDQTPTWLRSHEEIAGLPVPQAHTVTVSYSPPPAGASLVSPTYLEWHPDKGYWADLSGAALSTGGAISAAESWYARPWTVTQGGCSEQGVGSIAPSQAYSLQGPITNQGGGSWSLASTPHKSPASPWTSGPFSGSTTGYSDGAFNVVASGSLANTAKVTCAMTVASTDAKTVDVQVVIDPESCQPGYTGTPPNCVLPTPTPATYRWQDRTTLSCAALGHLLAKCNQKDDVTLQESIGGGPWGSIATCAYSTLQNNVYVDGGGGVFTSFSYSAPFTPYDSDPISNHDAGATSVTTSGCPP